MFKLVGVASFFFWIPAFADIIRSLAADFDSGTARQIAHAHTIFNVSLGFIFLPFTAPFASLIIKIMPKKEKADGTKPDTWYLDESSIVTPAIAINLARAEVARMAKLLWRMTRAVIIPFMSDERLIKKEVTEKEERDLLINAIPKRDEFFPHLSLLEGINMREKKVDFLEKRIVEYLVEIARRELSKEQSVYYQTD